MVESGAQTHATRAVELADAITQTIETEAVGMPAAASTPAPAPVLALAPLHLPLPCVVEVAGDAKALHLMQKSGKIVPQTFDLQASQRALVSRLAAAAYDDELHAVCESKFSHAACVSISRWVVHSHLSIFT